MSTKSVLIKLITISLFFYGFSMVGEAQKKNETDSIVNKYLHQLQQLKEESEHTQRFQHETLTDPYYFSLFNGKVINYDFLFMKSSNDMLRSSQDALTYIYTHRPWLVEEQLVIDPSKKQTDVATLPVPKLPKRVDEVETFQDEPIDVTPVAIKIYKPNFWKFTSDFSFQMMQNYFSENWYKGGESNHSFLASGILRANYDNKRRVIVENKLEVKVGFRSSSSDTEHRYIPNADLLRLTNELGIRAIKHWDYSASLQSWTQSFRGYRKNDKRVYSDFMSPFESVLSIGMKYRLTSRNKKFNMGLNLSPFACDFKYCGRDNLAQNFGIKEGNHKFEFGTNVTMNATWKPWNNISWDTRLYYYTNYHRTLMEWENTINLQINRYLSSRVFLYPRFDDNARRVGDHGYFQFKEYLSLGVNLSF